MHTMDGPLSPLWPNTPSNTQRSMHALNLVHTPTQLESVETEEEAAELRAYIEEHVAMTGSTVGQKVRSQCLGICMSGLRRMNGFMCAHRNIYVVGEGRRRGWMVGGLCIEGHVWP